MRVVPIITRIVRCLVILHQLHVKCASNVVRVEVLVLILALKCIAMQESVSHVNSL